MTVQIGQSEMRDAVAQERWVLLVAVITTGMAFIDATALNVALPAIQSQLQCSAAELLWIINAYGLLVAALLLAAGAVGDRWGQERVYMAGIGVFAVASIACGVAPGTRTLIAARALQGAGAAFMIPGGLAMITATVPTERRGRAIGMWTACTVVMTALGPLLGGVFAWAGWWRGIFLINVPLAMIALAVLVRRLPASQVPKRDGPIDGWGIFWSVCGLAALNLGFIEAGRRGWSDGLVLGGLVVVSISVVLFVLAEARAADPLLPLEFFRIKAFRVACLLTLLSYSALYGMNLFLPLNLIQLQNYNEVLAGLTPLPMILLMVVFSPWAGRFVDRKGPRSLLMLGPALAGIGYAGLAIPVTTSGPGDFWVWFFPPLVLLGIATGITTAPLSATIMESIPPSRVGMASALNSTLSRLSSVVGVAGLGTVALLTFSHSLAAGTAHLSLTEAQKSALADERAALGNARPPLGLLPNVRAAVEQAIELAFVRAFRAVSYTCAGASWLGALLAAFALGARPLRESETCN